MTAPLSDVDRAASEAFYEEFSYDAGVRDWLHPNGRHEHLKIELDDTLGGARGLRILDLGCGAGVLSSHLCRYGAVTGLDLSRSAIALAGLLEPRAHFEAGAIETHTADSAYDLITLFDVIEHVPPAERPELFKHLRRVLAPGGWIFLSTPHHDYLRWVQRHHPEQLQVVDEPIELEEITGLGAALGLELISYRAYEVDLRGVRQYQVAVLAPIGGGGETLFRPAPLRRLQARVAPAVNVHVPWLRRGRHAARLARHGSVGAAAWLLRLRAQPGRRRQR